MVGRILGLSMEWYAYIRKPITCVVQISVINRLLSLIYNVSLLADYESCKFKFSDLS